MSLETVQMTPAVFGFLSDAKEALTEFVNNCLLIAGGFLVGYLLGGVVGWALGRYVFRQKDPETLRRLGRPVGGVLLALIVAIIVFTGKGKPIGDGGDGKGTTSTDPNAGKNQLTTHPDTKIEPDLKKPKDVKPPDVVLRVTVYAGAAVTDDRAYQFEDDPTKITLEQLKKVILERKANEKGKVTIAILYPEDKNIAPGNPTEEQLHPSVAKVVRWARSEAKLPVELPPDK
jgi:hypothetical protein